MMNGNIGRTNLPRQAENWKKKDSEVEVYLEKPNGLEWGLEAAVWFVWPPMGKREGQKWPR